MEALVADGAGGAEVKEVENLPVRDTFVKIKVHAVALNPTDYKHLFNYAKGGEIVGIDSAGEVVEIGSKVETQVNVGDRIAGMVHGTNTYSPRDGCFAEYAELKDGIFAHLPDDWSWPHSAGLGAGVTTAGQGLFQSLRLPLPENIEQEPIPVLIYGGGTATGCLAIQFARLAGLKVITLASPREFDHLKTLGANECYDYHSENVGSRIRENTGDELMHAFDIITNDGSMKICAEALASKERNGVKPKVSLLLPGHTFPRDDVESHLTSGYSVIGETSMKYGKVVEGEPIDYEFGKMFWALTSKIMSEGRFTTHEVEVRKGLDGIVSGLHELRDGRVKGHKLVYTVS